MANNLYFSMSELIHSDTAVKYNINNMPDIKHLDNILNLIYYILQPIRIKFGTVIVSGGYRSYALWNKLKDLGKNPAKNSQHLTGQAADILVPSRNLKDVFNWIRDNIEYDQLLFEYDSQGNKWIHVSFNKGKNRKQAIDNYKAS